MQNIEKQKEQRRRRVRNKRRMRIKKEIMTQMGEIIFPNIPDYFINNIGNPEAIAAYDQSTADAMRNGMEGKWIDGTPMTAEKYAMLDEVFEKVCLEGQSEEVRKEILKRADDLNKIQRELKSEILEDEGKRIIDKWHTKYASGEIEREDALKYSSYECGCWLSVAKVLDKNNIPLGILGIEERDLIYKCTADGRWIDGRTMRDHFDAIILELVNNGQ